MRYQSHDVDCTDICSSSASCAGRYSSRQTSIGSDGKCSSCHAHAALAMLERICRDNGSALDEAYEALRGNEDALAAAIERLWLAEASAPTIDDVIMGVVR